MIIPQKLKTGDEIRVVAPSHSLSIISQETREIANKRFEDMGLRLSFGKHIEESDDFLSSSIASRIEDLHDAFTDKNVKGVITVIGGFNCNQLLRYIDYNVIKNNPKVFCGYSDTTALSNAFLTKTGLVTYSGPHYSTFGMKLHFEYTEDYFKKCLFSDDQFEVLPSKQWFDDEWWMHQDNREANDNAGPLVINEGEAEGAIIGANLCTFNLLHGTEYLPSFKDTILFVEDDEPTKPVDLDRDLQSVIHQPGFGGVRGIVIGRFQKASNITDGLLIQIIKTKKELENIPVIANVDFGHTYPLITFPIGGTAQFSAYKKDGIVLEILKH